MSPIFPNFGDSDYQLAAYAAALRVVTAYSAIEDIDVERELRRVRRAGESSPLTDMIKSAVRIASDFLVPDGLDSGIWKRLLPEERFYIKGVEIEAHGEYRDGVYQEFARGFGIRDYWGLLGSGAANQTRLKTPGELKGRDLSGEGFADRCCDRSSLPCTRPPRRMIRDWGWIISSRRSPVTGTDDRRSSPC